MMTLFDRKTWGIYFKCVSAWDNLKPETKRGYRCFADFRNEFERREYLKLLKRFLEPNEWHSI